MKIVYVGSLSEYGTCTERLWALEALGHQVIPVDTVPRAWRSLRQKIITGMFRLAGRPIDVSKANKRIVDVASSDRPDLLWIDKGLTIRRETLQKARKAAPGLVIAHFNPDDPFGPGWRHGWETFLAALPEYDCLFVPRRANVAEYQQKGARRVVHELPGWGFDPRIHKPYELDERSRARFACDVGFIGAFEEPRAKMLLELGRAGIEARIWGPWPKKYWQPNLRIEPGPLYGDTYGKALSSFRIALCFLRKYNRDGHTSRSVEIPACGAFMLAERTEEHLALFEPGKEAEFFSSVDEMVDKVRYYLNHESERAKIAYSGRERCLRSRYSNQELMARRLRTLTSLS